MAIFITLVTGGLGNAAVYKYIDENGNVAYSDKPVQGSKKLKIHSTRPSSESSSEDGEGSDGESSGDRELADENQVVYKSLDILTPKSGKVIDERSGAVQIIFLPTPSLGKTDQLVITVDGKDISKGRDANFSLSNLARGGHTVNGKIIDANGKTKITSNVVTFEVGKGESLALEDN